MTDAVAPGSQPGRKSERIPEPSPRLLEPVGISADEEDAYLHLLRNGPGSIASVSRATGRPRSQSERSLNDLESLGLVTRLPRKPPVFSASRPDIAVEALVLRRLEDLERTRAEAHRLLEAYGGPRPGAVGDLVETITSPEGAGRLSQQIQRTAQEELIGFIVPPFLTESNEGGDEALRRRIRVRALYDETALGLSWIRDALLASSRQGEEARIARGLPMKFVIADRRTAIVPMSSDGGPIEGALLVHRSPLLDALLALFESYWDRGIPVRRAASQIDRTTDPENEPSSDERRLLLLLLSGAKDEAVARELGVARRTVQRRLDALMRRVHASNRLQLMVRASQRGWV